MVLRNIVKMAISSRPLLLTKVISCANLLNQDKNHF